MPWIRVSKCGRVQSCLRKQGEWKEMTPSIAGRGYKAICTRDLSGKKKYKNYSVHHLVLETFVGPRPAGMHACHNNGIPHDNRLENLRYDTPAGNSADQKRHGTAAMGSRHGVSKLSEANVIDIDYRLRRGDELSDIAKFYGVCANTILYIALGRTWRHLTGRYYRQPGW
jgi:hypothetical protein